MSAVTCVPRSLIECCSQTGSIPNGATSIAALTSYNSYFDVRLNFMSCCGIGPLVRDFPYFTNVRYTLLLPHGRFEWNDFN